MNRRTSINLPATATATATATVLSTGNRRRVHIAALLLLGAAALATGCERRPFAAGDMAERIAYCVNRVCPITGEVLGDRALAVSFRGNMIGVYNSRAAESWGRLPERVRQDMLRDLVEHANRR